MFDIICPSSSLATPRLGRLGIANNAGLDQSDPLHSVNASKREDNLLREMCPPRRAVEQHRWQHEENLPNSLLSGWILASHHLLQHHLHHVSTVIAENPTMFTWSMASKAALNCRALGWRTSTSTSGRVSASSLSP